MLAPTRRGGDGRLVVDGVDLSGPMLHAADFERPSTWHNGSLIRHFSSGDVLAEITDEFPDHQLVRDTPIDVLRDGDLQWAAPLAPGILGAFVSPANAIRRGYRMVTGIGETQRVWTDEEQASVVARVDRELEVETVRRDIAPDAPSRLTCLYLVREDEHALRDLGEMFRGRVVLRCDVEWVVRASELDRSWFDRYRGSGDPRDLERYWRGDASESPRWEILIDGAVRFRAEAPVFGEVPPMPDGSVPPPESRPPNG